jgi:hypothetical protein
MTTFGTSQDDYLRKVVADRDALLKALRLALPILEEELECLERSYLPDPNPAEWRALGFVRDAVRGVKAAIAKAGRDHRK